MKHLKLFENFESNLNEGTDAIVAMKTKEGKIIATKVQSDGYPHIMVPSLNNISDYNDVEKLIKGGEMSALIDGEPEYYKKQDYKASLKLEITEEDDENYNIGKIDNELGGSYLYYYTQEDGWKVQSIGNKEADITRFLTMEDAEKRRFDLPK